MPIISGIQVDEINMGEKAEKVNLIRISDIWYFDSACTRNGIPYTISSTTQFGNIM